MIIYAVIQGLLIGFGLIAVIGPQNSFLIRQGLQRQHVLLCVVTCSLIDMILISAGVFGLGGFFKLHPAWIEMARWFGALFLTVYGLMAFKSAIHPAVFEDMAEGTIKSSAKKTIFILLGLGFLNPHAYLDAVVLIGSVSTQYRGGSHYGFGIGAILASIIWFCSISYGARLLSPLFRKPITWRVMDVLVGCVMLLIACSLVWYK
jgi:L-lysine exporter family protein LysE/ArgO